MGDIEKLNLLASFSVGFDKEYDGRIIDLEHEKRIITGGIMNDNFYQWNHDGNICSVAQAMPDEYDLPSLSSESWMRRWARSNLLTCIRWRSSIHLPILHPIHCPALYLIWQSL